jgi:sugar phosphate permease
MSTLLYLIPALIFITGAIFFFQGFKFKGKLIKSKVIAIILGLMFLVTIANLKEENNPTPPPTPKVEKTPEQIAEDEKEKKLLAQIYFLKQALKNSAKDHQSPFQKNFNSVLIAEPSLQIGR